MLEKSLGHLFLDGRFYNTEDYTSINQGGPTVLARNDINREKQGKYVKVRFNEAVKDFRDGSGVEDFVYLEFTSAINFHIDFNKFDGTKEIYRIAYIKEIRLENVEVIPQTIYKVGLSLHKDAIDDFLTKIEKFLNEYTSQSSGSDNPKPKFNALISNIADIQAATLQSFWQENEHPFPEWDKEVWWEIWIDNREIQNREASFLQHICKPYNIEIGQKWLRFPEHSVGLIRGSAEALSLSVLYCNKLAELRKPKETSDFFTDLNRIEQHEWVKDLKARTIVKTNNSKISVCLLDTGVNFAHPLLEDLIPKRHLDTVIPKAGISDTGGRSGHGTPMAGLIFYGDLTEALAMSNQIEIFHHLESVKLISSSEPNDPQNYGALTQEAIDRALIINSDHKRIVCLAITSDETEHLGKPSSWSAAIDQYSFGDESAHNISTLICVSAGNLTDEHLTKYPLSNKEISIEAPAQAFNALTVGAYTNMDIIDIVNFPNAVPLAKRGELCPRSSTSLSWERGWSNKPDIVMEGGNYALQHGNIICPDSLALLTTSKGSNLTKWLTTFGDTSAATALATRFAAQLYVEHPQLWPQTIRGLIVHSANWTPAMLRNRKVQNLSLTEKSELIKTVGYGVPNLSKAMKSASNSLTLISESELKPYKWEDSRVKTDEFHLYKLPWPTEALMELFNTPVALTVTLSYFIEPNPGNKRYSTANNYMSHALRIKMIDKNESLDAFAGRVSKVMQDEDYEKEGREKDWALGENLRNKGSIHKDIWEGSAADLATRNVIAVYPTTGWWKTRKKLNRYDNKVKYSLIIGLESPNVEIDIYTPVKQLIELKVPVEITNNN